jgi:hypothetical protein
VESVIINIIGLKDAAVYGVQVNIQLLPEFWILHSVSCNGIPFVSVVHISNCDAICLNKDW